jgi:hypothetical protein
MYVECLHLKNPNPKGHAFGPASIRERTSSNFPFQVHQGQLNPDSSLDRARNVSVSLAALPLLG